jgi:hypothetical protein
MGIFIFLEKNSGPCPIFEKSRRSKKKVYKKTKRKKKKESMLVVSLAPYMHDKTRLESLLRFYRINSCLKSFSG